MLPTLLTTTTAVLLTLLSLHGGVHGGGGGGDTTEFDFGTLALTSLKLIGDAHLNNGSVHLTKDLQVPDSGSGRVFYSKPVTFRQPGSNSPASFNTFFSFTITNLNPSSIGGGLAFLISPNAESEGSAGGSLGLGNGSFIAVEFDTLMDIEYKDINGNHVGFDLNSMVSKEVCDLGEVNVELKSGNVVNVWVEYSGSGRVFDISVSYSNVKPKGSLLSVSVDLDEYVNDSMYVGFSGSTQGSTETHTIDWWSFSSFFGDSEIGTETPPSSAPQIVPFQLPPSPPQVAASVSSPAISPSKAKSTVRRSESSSCHNQLCRHNPGAVAGVVTASAFLLAIFCGLLLWCFTKKSLFNFVNRGSCSFATDIINTPKEFSYKEIKLATKGFNSDRIIGHGAFGTVYKGVLPDTGNLIAVKRCSHGGEQGKEEFLSELSIIATLRHRNLVRLQGWCHEKGEILLIYDYMTNGSLDKVLFESRIVLLWTHRKKILNGIASALAYLHQECETMVIHRDVKTSNIMLDGSFNARLGDFGLARQIEHDQSPAATVAAGTMGYLAPEYLLTGRATEKTDVFSFGAVVLEVASGRRPIQKEGLANGAGNLVDWVWSLHREGRLLVAADERLDGEYDGVEMRRVLLVGLACSNPDPMVRPTMRSVVQMLVGETEVPIVPMNKPSMSFSNSQLLLSLQDSVSDCNALLTISTSSSERSSFLGKEGPEDLV